MDVRTRTLDDGTVSIVASTSLLSTQWLLTAAGAPYKVREVASESFVGIEVLNGAGQRARLCVARVD